MAKKKGPTLTSDGHQENHTEIYPCQPDDNQLSKKKKIVRSEVADGEHNVPQTDQPKRKSKKRKERRASAPETSPDVHHVDQDQGTQPGSSKRKHSDIDDAHNALEVEDLTPPTESQMIPDSQIDPELLSSSGNPSASAFLSAVLAAASSMTEASSSQNVQQINNPPDIVSYSVIQQPPDQVHLQPQQLFPSVPLSDLSNDDILRVMQEADINKIASVLKTLHEAASAANVSLIPPHEFLVHPAIHTPMPVSQHHMPPGGFVGQPLTVTENHRRVDIPPPLAQHTNPHHAQLLCTKWLNASKLAELVEREGLVYKKGKFSAIEEQQLKQAIDDYVTARQMNDEQLNELIFAPPGKSGDSSFWTEITSAIPLRPIIAVYHHVRRIYHPLKHQGKWMPTEDHLLKQAVTELGPQWEKVSERVGRSSSDCRDRYRNHISHREVRVSGQWTKEEEEQLIKIVTEMTVERGGNLEDEVFWGKVSDRMGNKRGRQQCRIKWTDSLVKDVKTKGMKMRWGQHDACILIQKIDALQVRDDTEIDWKTLSDPVWNIWSAHSLQRRWLSMKRSIKGFEDMTHQEIMDILRVKKTQVPESPVSPPKRRKVVSSSDVVDGESGVAGPSCSSG